MVGIFTACLGSRLSSACHLCATAYYFRSPTRAQRAKVYKPGSVQITELLECGGASLHCQERDLVSCRTQSFSIAQSLWLVQAVSVDTSSLYVLLTVLCRGQGYALWCSLC